MRDDQEHRIQCAIKLAKEDGLSIMIDGSTDIQHDQKPLNMLVATSSAIFFCETKFHDPVESENADTLVRLVREFCRKWLPGDLPDFVRWICTDNESKMLSMTKKLTDSSGLFPNAKGIGCLAHGAARIGAIIKDRKSIAELHSLCVALSGLLKGKVFVHRRWLLRKAMQAQGRVVATLPDKWGGTRWDSWYLCVVFVARNCGFLQKWISELTIESESQAWASCAKKLKDHGPLIKVQSLFVMHAFQSLYEAISKEFQLSPVQRGARTGTCPRTPNHLFYNKLQSIHTLLVDLSTITESSKLPGFIQQAMLTGKVKFSAVQAFFHDVTGTAATIAKKYLTNDAGQLAKAMRIFDPYQRTSLGVRDLEEYTLVIPLSLHSRIMESHEGEPSEWSQYMDLRNPAPKTNILSWWESMSSIVPCLSRQAAKMLRVLLTTMQVEASFSTFKMTRDDQQWSMTDAVHLDRISFMFNGVLPPPVECIQAAPASSRCERPPARSKRQTETNINDDVVQVHETDRLPAETSIAHESEPKSSPKGVAPSSQLATADQPPPKKKAKKSPDQPQQAESATINADDPAKKKTKKSPNQPHPAESATINADDPAAQLQDY